MEVQGEKPKRTGRRRPQTGRGPPRHAATWPESGTFPTQPSQAGHEGGYIGGKVQGCPWLILVPRNPRDFTPATAGQQLCGRTGGVAGSRADSGPCRGLSAHWEDRSHILKTCESFPKQWLQLLQE